MPNLYHIILGTVPKPVLLLHPLSGRPERRHDVPKSKDRRENDLIEMGFVLL